MAAWIKCSRVLSGNKIPIRINLDLVPLIIPYKGQTAHSQITVEGKNYYLLETPDELVDKANAVRS
jgi:hypothetical protein